MNSNNITNTLVDNEFRSMLYNVMEHYSGWSLTYHNKQWEISNGQDKFIAFDLHPSSVLQMIIHVEKTEALKDNK